MAIHRLREQTIGQIAAGEVIERPAAVIKELIENAIDASAGRIQVEIEEGGSRFIEVRDDGVGIALDELPLAVERHATSKLQDISDLERLSSLGFRGEALASVGAVADLVITSIGASETAGGRIRVAYGDVQNVEPTSWGSGTSIRVSNLFRNAPARLQFLRTPATESAYAQRIVTAYALAYPHIAWSFTQDGRVQFQTTGSGDRLTAVLEVWGPEIEAEMVRIEPYSGDHEGYQVEGVISLPTLSRSRRDHQFLFAQGRLIQSRQLSAAIEQAYHTQLMVGRRPIGCVLLTCPPDKIDVNVHPTKSEVRFVEDRLVFAIVQRATRATLLEHAPDQPAPVVTSAPLGPPAWQQPGSQDASTQRRLTLARPDRAQVDPKGPWTRWNVADEDQEERPSGPPRTDRSLPLLRVLGQVANSFITAEGPDGLYLIDQHAADERVQFERLMAEAQSGDPASQTLLEPMSLELSASQFDMFERSQDHLRAIGFDIEPFGGTTVQIRSIPAILRKRDPRNSLVTILDELIDGGRGDSLFESLTISAACHSSIRANQPLSLLEMRELVRQLEECSTPMACGHGRPTIIRMSAEDLARQFMRR
ncbi:MAG: DNA mismatch repair endonuclease MutL [Chloroflexota bacterium]